MTENYTALFEQHKKAGASFTDFGGWQMPLKYESELAEHHAVRKAAGLFDLSHMGEVWVTGPDAAAFLDYALVGKISAVAIGKAKYSLICNEDGGTRGTLHVEEALTGSIASIDGVMLGDWLQERPQMPPGHCKSAEDGRHDDHISNYD